MEDRGYRGLLSQITSKIILIESESCLRYCCIRLFSHEGRFPEMLLRLRDRSYQEESTALSTVQECLRTSRNAELSSRAISLSMPTMSTTDRSKGHGKIASVLR